MSSTHFFSWISLIFQVLTSDSSLKCWTVGGKATKKPLTDRIFFHCLTVNRTRSLPFEWKREKERMTTASLCSSTQINGFGAGLRLQKTHLYQPSPFTLTRYCFSNLFSNELYWVWGFILVWMIERSINVLGKSISEMLLFAWAISSNRVKSFLIFFENILVLFVCCGCKLW